MENYIIVVLTEENQMVLKTIGKYTPIIEEFIYMHDK